MTVLLARSTVGSSRWGRSNRARPPKRSRPEQSPEACCSLRRVVVPLATVEVDRAHAATLESASRSRTGRDRSRRASQPAPCRRGRSGVRAEPSSRTGIPLLRLRVGSKGGEVLEFAVARHVGPPLSCLRLRSGEGSVAEDGDSFWHPVGLGRSEVAPSPAP